MNMSVLRSVMGGLASRPRDFMAGWMEGKTRYDLAQSKDVIAGSMMPRGSIMFAASQAAVAFHQALGDG